MQTPIHDPDERIAGADRKSVASTLAICAVFSMVLALSMAICRAEVRTGFHRACLNRTTDMQVFARHRIEGTAGDTHPALTHYIERNWSIGPLLIEALVCLGCSFETAVTLATMLFRTLFGMGVSWLLLAATNRRAVALLGVPLAFALPEHTVIYRHIPQLGAITGVMATSVFLVACSLALLGYRRLAVLAWLLQGWAHPVTFICWSPVFIGLLLAGRVSHRAAICEGASGAGEMPAPGGGGPPHTRRRWIILWLAILVIGPTLVASIAGLLEQGGRLPVRGDDYYWATVRVQLSHCTFLFTHRYARPLHYLSQVVALLLLSRSRVIRGSPLYVFNGLAASLGIGMGLMYATCVETQFSVVACMCLPLRFEGVLYSLIVANLAMVMCRSGQENPRQAVFAAAYATLLLTPSLKPILWAWAWAIGNNWLEDNGEKKRRHLYAPLIAGTAVIVGYLLLMSSGMGRMWNFKLACTNMQAPIWLAAGMVICQVVARFPAKEVYVLAWLAIMCVTILRWPIEPWKLMTEVSALATGQPESSTRKQACDWINEHIPPGTPVLSHYDVFPQLMTHVKTSVNFDLASFPTYAPSLARPMAEEIKMIYGVDLRDLARKHIRFSPTEAEWNRARDRALGRAGDRELPYQFVIEPASTPVWEDGPIVFTNDYLRVYKAESR